ncbi:MAG: hypothetical protein E7184_00080 [Erysipelotrichaceae bacterium]|nr:hypothetical protein [Erysipelotrichaceae bacterium]
MVRIYNKGIDKNKFNYVKNYIVKTAELILEKMSMKLDLKIQVINSENTIKNEMYEWAASVSDNNTIQIFENLIDELVDEKEDYFDACLYHEMLHLYDLNCIHSNKHSNYNFWAKAKTVEQFLEKKGLLMWTEFYAYYKSSAVYKNHFEYPTFLEMVNTYKELLDFGQKVYTNEFSKEDANLLIKKINQFCYMSARYLACDIYGKHRYLKYSEKNYSRKEFKQLEKIYDGCYKRIVKMFHGTYGKYMDNRLINLGEYIFYHFYYKLGVLLTKRKGRIFYNI